MRRGRILFHPVRERGKRLSLEELAEESGARGIGAETLYFRHRCDDAWYEELIEAQGLRGKKITPVRLRRLIVEALERYREEKR